MNAEFMISEYITDFGTKVSNLPVKMLAGHPSFLPDEYTLRTANPCPASAGLFRPRALIATFANNKVRFPIGNRANLADRARELINRGAICVDYEGEYWPYVPATLFNGTYRTQPLTNDTDGRRTTGTFSYVSDILGNIVLPFNFESTPEELLTAALGCVQGYQQLGFCSGSQGTGVKARRLKGKGLNQERDDVERENPIRRTYARDIKISAQNPTQCAQSNASLYYCFSYVGERIRNLHLLLGEVSAQ